MAVIRPQAGPQEAFLASPADIAIYGGSAGGGKSWALLMEPLRHVTRNSQFFTVFFRRTTVQVRNPGGLWDESVKLYGPIGAQPVQQTLEWRFPGGGRVKFAHLEHADNVLDWQGAQIPLICFDELTHFTKGQFWYLLSRNRSMSGVRPYVRATCNPDADSWVAELIAWWIDPGSGQPIPERAGVLRWFVRINDALVWADTPGELLARFPGIPPKSLTFIPARLTDNRALMAADPGYLANLMALPTVDRERLLGGNWKIRPAAGLYFRRQWVRIIELDDVPPNLKMVRGWDLAATPKTENNDPDWTCGTKIGKCPATGRFYVLDHVRLQGSPNDVQAAIAFAASQDGKAVTISLPQDPGQAGKWQATSMTKALAGYTVRTSTEGRAAGVTTDTPTGKAAKITRFGPFSTQAETGRATPETPNVLVVRGDWNEGWFSQLEAFPDARHDDDADSTARAFNELNVAPGPAKVRELRI
jgi:predicted phage terminase large subunit-like protein